MSTPHPPKKTQQTKPKKPTKQSLKTFVTNIDTGQERQHFPYHRWRYPTDFFIQLALLPMDVSRYHVMLKRSLACARTCLNPSHQANIQKPKLSICFA